MIKFYRFPRSTNVERVALALAHKKLPVESIAIDPADRSEVLRVSAQDLVPVIEDGPRVVVDSMAIVAYLEDTYPETPRLYPSDRARRAEVELFVDWFNKVWKRAPNALVSELGKPEAVQDAAAIAQWGVEMQSALDRLESMLWGRDHLMGEFGAADVAAFPFVKYATLPDPSSPHAFHHVLARFQELGTRPNVLAWIERVNRRPRA